MKRGLGQLETQFMAYAQMRGLSKVRTGDLTGPLSLSPQQERSLLSGLARPGMITRVKRGLYLIPPRLPLGGKWNPQETLSLNTLMEECDGTYQICGPNAFNRYGLDEQIPTRLYVYNNRLSGDRTIGSLSLTLIKVADDRLGDIEEFTTPEGLRAVYSSLARTLVDAVYDWSRFDSLPRGYGWIQNELSKKRVTAGELVDATLRYGNQGTLRRIGALLEREGVSGKPLAKLEKALRPSSCLIPWIPGRPKRGKVNKRWGLIINEQA